MNIELSELPSIPLSGRQYLPSCPGIYFVIDSLNQVLYVGKASNLRARWQGHHRFEQLKKIHKKTPVRIAWLVCDHSQLSSLELSYIDKYYPILNNTSVRQRKIISSQVILSKSLEKIAQYSIVFGMHPRQHTELPTIVIKYFWNGFYGSGKETRIIRRNLKALNNRYSSTLKWVEFIRRKYTGWWKCKCSGYQIELGPMPINESSIHRRGGLYDRISPILLSLVYGNFSSFTSEQIKAATNIKITLAEVGSLLQSHPDGLIHFPLQANAQLIKIAGTEMLGLTPAQLDEIKESYPDAADLMPILDDPIKFFYDSSSPPRPLRSKLLKDL